MKKILLPFTFLALTCAFFSCKDNGGDNPQPNVKITVTTNAVTDISGTTAKSGGNITSAGKPVISSRGVCWGTAENPTTEGSKSSDGTGTGEFTSELSGLEPGTKYYVRAYAVQGSETTYGNQQSFVAGLNAPTVTTDEVTEIGMDTATGGGKVVSEGDKPVTEAGLCWSTSENPTIEDANTAEDLAADGTFTSQLIYLSPNTTYYVRAYATSEAGTGYGNQVSFKTNEEAVVEIPDNAFKNYLTQHFDTSRDGKIQQSEALLVTEIDLQAVGGVKSLEGIKSFTNLRVLRAATTDAAIIEKGEQNALTSIDVAGMKNLEEIWNNGTGITSINLEGCTSLNTLHCLLNNLTKIDVSTCTSLRELHLNENTQLAECDLTKNANLVNLGLIRTKVARIDLAGNTNLNGVWADSGAAEFVDVSGCTALKELWCEANRVSSLNVTGCTELFRLHAGTNATLETVTGLNTCKKLSDLQLFLTAVKSVDVTGFTELSTLWVCDIPALETLTGTNTCPKLIDLRVFHTALTSVDVTGCSVLNQLWTLETPSIATITGLETCTNLTDLRVFGSSVASLDIYSDKLLELHCGACPNLASINVSRSPLLHTIFASNCPLLTSLDVSKCAFVMNILHLAENNALQTLTMKTGQTATDKLIPEATIINYVN